MLDWLPSKFFGEVGTELDSAAAFFTVSLNEIGCDPFTSSILFTGRFITWLISGRGAGKVLLLAAGVLFVVFEFVGGPFGREEGAVVLASLERDPNLEA